MLDAFRMSYGAGNKCIWLKYTNTVSKFHLI